MKTLLGLMTVLLSFNLLAVKIDKKASSFVWTGTKVTGKHWGKIGIKKAQLKGDKGQIASGTLVMDMKSITVDDLSGGTAEKFLGHIKSADFFDVAKFPESKLEIKSITNNTLTGKLTIKGKTHEIKVPVKKDGKKYTGELNFDRTKFDMVYGSGNFFKNLGDKAINDTVNLKFNVVFM
jgi:polyisoprenoid-binding protein YceI